MAKRRKTVRIKPRKTPRDALDWQERHSPTVEISVDDPEATRRARRNLTRCRQSEVWRHNRLTGMQREAEREMEIAWRSRTAGIGLAVSRYGAARGTAAHIDLSAMADGTWREWAQLAPQRRIMVAVVIECLTEPKTLGQIERDHRMREGQAFVHYTAGLDLWCEVRGWSRMPARVGNLEPERA